MKLNFSYSKDIARGFSKYEGTLEDFAEVIKSNINYSAFIFDNEHRKEINSKLELCNMIILDFDDGMSLDEAKYIFKQYTNIIATTKSHQKEKNGIVCDRFRVVFPLIKPLVNVTIDEYKMMIKMLINRHGADRYCSDISRFFYGFEKSEVEINYSKNFFDADILLRQAKMYHKLKKDIETKENEAKNKSNNVNFTAQKTQYKSDKTKLEWLREILCTDKFKEYMKFEKFGEGGRNLYLYSAAKHLQEEGLNNDEVSGCVMWLNRQGNWISENEIERTIFKSLGLT
ncbi:hypothetical protein KKC13_08800 [bacterium]|nr:hypothetical protein [bacterium]MBU1958632.1 hypothetical protein [bacterium]